MIVDDGVCCGYGFVGVGVGDVVVVFCVFVEVVDLLGLFVDVDVG